MTVEATEMLVNPHCTIGQVLHIGRFGGAISRYVRVIAWKDKSEGKAWVVPVEAFSVRVRFGSEDMLVTEYRTPSPLDS